MLYSEAEIVELRSNVSIDRVYLIDDYPSKKYFERLSSAQKKSFLENHETYVEGSSRAKHAINSADIIIYSAGTQHSSLYPTYLTAMPASDQLLIIKRHLNFLLQMLEQIMKPLNTKLMITLKEHLNTFCLSENRNFEIRELFTYAFINKSNRQKSKLRKN